MWTRALAIVSLITICACTFNITDLIVPKIVEPDQHEVILECKYDADFTLLSWFKGPNEFFRYRPGVTPSTRSFPILGVGRIELLACGPNSCRLQLSSLTQDATGHYKCDIEREKPPYKYESRTAYMEVYGHEHRRPSLEGMAEEYDEDDVIKAYCRGTADSEMRWYINGRELEDKRGSKYIVRNSSRLLFQGVPPTVTVQCAEFRYGKLLGSKEVKARWRKLTGRNDAPQEQRSFASRISLMNSFVLLLACAKVIY